MIIEKAGRPSSSLYRHERGERNCRLLSDKSPVSLQSQSVISWAFCEAKKRPALYLGSSQEGVRGWAEVVVGPFKKVTITNTVFKLVT